MSVVSQTRRPGSGIGRVGGPGASVALALTVIALSFLANSAAPAYGEVGLAVPTGGHAANVSSCPQLTLPTPICRVMTIFLENQNVSHVLKRAPFQEYLSDRYAFASRYYSVLHFSYPNYVAATSGSQTNYATLHNKTNIADLVRNASGGMTWKGYYENMAHPCDNTASGGYRISHDPFVFYTDIWSNQSYCQSHVVSFVNLTHDLSTGQLPNYAFIGPNNSHSCWKQGLPVCDPWLKTFVSPIVNSSMFQSMVIFITYDEGATLDKSGVNGTTGGGHIFTVAVSPYACQGFVSTQQYNHYNLLTTTEWLLGLGRTGYNDSWASHPPMKDLFCFPKGSGSGGVPVLLNDSGSSLIAVPAGRPLRDPTGEGRSR